MMRLVVALGLVMLVALGGLGLHAVRDGYQFVERRRLQAALLTFRPDGARRLGEAGGRRGPRPRPVDPGRA